MNQTNPDPLCVDALEDMFTTTWMIMWETWERRWGHVRDAGATWERPWGHVRDLGRSPRVELHKEPTTEMTTWVTIDMITWVIMLMSGLGWSPHVPRTVGRDFKPHSVGKKGFDINGENIFSSGRHFFGCLQLKVALRSPDLPLNERLLNVKIETTFHSVP